MKKLALIGILLMAFGHLQAQAQADSISSPRKAVEGEKAYTYFPSNYFIGNSSFSLPKGQGYYANTLLFFNDFYYGVTDHFSVGAGFVPFFLLGTDFNPIWVKAKWAYPLADKFRISAGVSFLYALIFAVPAGENNLVFAFPFAGATYGTPHHNVSLNVHYGFLLNDLKNGSTTPLFALSTKQQITPRTHFMADLFFNSDIYDNFNVVGIVGMQTAFIGLSLDYGLMIPYFEGQEKLIGIPYVGVKIPFNLK